MTCLGENTVTDLLDAVLEADRRGEVEAHIASCDACRRLVSELLRRAQTAPPDEPAGRARALWSAATLGSLRPPELAREIRPGATIGRYVIRERLGRGAMGEVFAAFDPELDRSVALKLVHPARAQRDRIRREARALARLAHPNVVAAFDAGEHDGELFIAMELVDGTDLRTWMRRPRSIAEVLETFVQAGRGLAAAHAAGLVHRDVKPENVVVGNDGRVRVVDFGLAAGRDGTADLVGTPAYMAPEQLESGGATPASDQFAFCVALYEALHGARPFVANLSPDVASGPSAPPTAHAVAPHVTAALARGLALDPARRFPTIDALLEALEDAPPRRWRRRWLVAGVLGALAASGGVWFAVRDEDPCARAAVAPDLDGDALAMYAVSAAARSSSTAAIEHVSARLVAWQHGVAAQRGDTCRASHVDHTESAELFDLRMECLGRQVREVDAALAALRSPSNALVDAAPATFDHTADASRCRGPRETLTGLARPANPVRDAELRARLGVAQALHTGARDEQALAAALSIAGAAEAARDEGALADAWWLAGRARTMLMQSNDARDALHHALVAAEAAGDVHERALISLDLAGIEDVLDHQADIELAVAQARAIVDRTGDRAIGWRVREGEGRVASRRYDPANPASALFRRALAEHREIEPRETTDDLTILFSLVVAYEHEHERDHEIAAARDAVALSGRLDGVDHPNTIPAISTLAEALMRRGGHADEALGLARHAYDLAQRYRSPYVSIATRELATALIDVHRNADAEVLFARAVANHTGPVDGPYALLQQEHLRNLRALHRLPEARAAAVEVLAYVRATRATPELVRALKDLAQIDVALQHSDDAQASLLEVTRLTAGTHDAWQPEWFLAQLAEERHNYEDAMVHAQRAAAVASGAIETSAVNVTIASVLVDQHRDLARASELLKAARGVVVANHQTELIVVVDHLQHQLRSGGAH